VNALADLRVAKYLNDNFVSTYLKVGAFQIVNGQKVGGNVASYFCLGDGSVLHALAGPTNAEQLLSEARWASDIRKAAELHSTSKQTGNVDTVKYARYLAKAHGERYHVENNTFWQDKKSIPVNMPRNTSRPAQTHWLLARNAMGKIETISPVLWRQILREEWTDLPVAKR
jgi:hypothetical protein